MILLPAIFKIIPCIDWGIAFFGILIEIADHLRPKKGLNTGLQSLGILGVMLDLAPQVFEYCGKVKNGAEPEHPKYETYAARPLAA